VIIVLGVTGCIGAYKAVELIRRLQDRGHDVQVIATRHALKFVTPLTFETISRHPLVCHVRAPATGGGAHRRPPLAGPGGAPRQHLAKFAAASPTTSSTFISARRRR
jgi:nucleoside-diphosphate-sugar epimerase